MILYEIFSGVKFTEIETITVFFFSLSPDIYILMMPNGWVVLLIVPRGLQGVGFTKRNVLPRNLRLGFGLL